VICLRSLGLIYTINIAWSQDGGSRGGSREGFEGGSKGGTSKGAIFLIAL
jgi:hypothetical protein